jgi:hypothetical protein
MSKTRKKESLPCVLDLTAGQLVDKLLNNGVETFTALELATGINRAALSRFRSGKRVANESDYRRLAKYGISQKVAGFR